MRPIKLLYHDPWHTCERYSQLNYGCSVQSLVFAIFLTHDFTLLGTENWPMIFITSRLKKRIIGEFNHTLAQSTRVPQTARLHVALHSRYYLRYFQENDLNIMHTLWMVYKATYIAILLGLLTRSEFLQHQKLKIRKTGAYVSISLSLKVATYVCFTRTTRDSLCGYEKPSTISQ